MPHQALILAIGMRQVAEIGGIRMRRLKMLAVDGEAGIYGIAPHVDDAGFRQGAMNQAQVLEVRRHLIEHARHAGRQCIEPLPIFARQGLQQFLAGIATLQRRLPALRCAAPVDQFAGTEHLAVRSQDLLGQRRARPQHADDEHRPHRRRWGWRWGWQCGWRWRGRWRGRWRRQSCHAGIHGAR